MTDQPKLLVVDDEEAICEGCSRIFTRQGFQVAKSCDARDGLQQAQTGDYSAVLLDIKMPEMNGLEFLSQLRRQHVDVPVILMTGFPNVPNAISAIQLGASGFITKPFTPEEITQAVQRFAVPGASQAVSTGAEEPHPFEESRVFWQHAWLQPAGDDRVRVGAVLAELKGATVAGIEMPRLGDVLYQGLPLARVTLSDGQRRIIPAPATGLVQAVNQDLEQQPRWLGEAPCDRGWVAELCATRVVEEARECRERQVLILTEDQARAGLQARQLRRFGCICETSLAPVTDAAWRELEPRLALAGLVMLDAVSLGDAGPSVAAEVRRRAPKAKIVVAASPASDWEFAYRAQKILYYGVDLFQDGELVDLLDSAFRANPPRPPRPSRPTRHDQPVASISITNRQRAHVTLMAQPELLWRNSGLGREIRALLHQGLYPVQTKPGNAPLTSRDVLDAMHDNDAVILLVARDTGRLPGSLSRDSIHDYLALAESEQSKLATLVIQPSGDGMIESLDEATKTMLARHITAAMASAEPA